MASHLRMLHIVALGLHLSHVLGHEISLKAFVLRLLVVSQIVKALLSVPNGFILRQMFQVLSTIGLQTLNLGVRLSLS